jgi:YbbR domain-containing protein
MKDIGLKLLSLAIAVLLGFFVRSDGNSSQAGFTVPVQLQAIPEGMMVVAPLRAEVQVNVRGPSFLVSQLLITPRVVVLNLPADVKSSFVRSISSEDLNLPSSVQLLDVAPAELEFQLERRVSKEFPVVIPQIGTVPEPLKLAAIQVDPIAVTVSGPESEIAKIKRVESDPIDLRGITEDSSRVLALRSPGGLTELSARSVTAGVVVRVREIERRFPGVAVSLLPAGIESSLKIAPRVVTIQLQGPAAEIRALRADQIQATVTVPVGTKSGAELAVTAKAPEGMTVLSIEPSSVTATAGTRIGSK